MCVIDLNPHGSMTDCNGNPVQFMVSFLTHPISLHCLLNFSKLCSYSVLAVTVYIGVRAASHYGRPSREAVGLRVQTLLRVQRNLLKIGIKYSFHFL
jgi:hypothetical protein